MNNTIPANARFVTVVTTYLEIPTQAQFRPAWAQWRDHAEVQVQIAHEPLPAFYRFLYTTVGKDYYWRDRLTWSDEQLHTYLSQPSVTLMVLYVRGTPAGYVELNTASDELGTEVAYFGLIPQFHGRGLGKYLLSVGVQQAYADGAERVWVHTCTLDSPHALANYQARGFVPYRSVSAEVWL